jgi:hypothetical protein
LAVGICRRVRIIRLLLSNLSILLKQVSGVFQPYLRSAKFRERKEFSQLGAPRIRIGRQHLTVYGIAGSKCRHPHFFPLILISFVRPEVLTFGRMVIKEYPEHKAKHVPFTPSYRGGNGNHIAAYDIELDEAGFLKSSRRLQKGESGSNVWYAYLDTNGPSPWFNDQTYIDTLSPEAMARFIEVTHEVYRKKIGDKFGTVVPCIFTDEP